MSRLIRSGFLFAMFGFGLATPVFSQSYKELIGYNALLAEKGGALEDGAGLRVLQPEAPQGGNYMPGSGAQFTGKSITNGTPGGSTGSSSHATGVAFRFYGNTVGIAPGIADITGYDANDYIDRVLGVELGGDPLAQGFDVGNHSYIDDGLTNAETTDVLQRFDFLINRDDTVMAVGVNNGAGNTTPDLLSPSYNAIAVGRSDGGHSRGETTSYGLGRFKPDIVAPEVNVSLATPIVAGAAAVLKHAAAGTGASQNEVIKSMLFAGATKEEFASWNRSTTQPIDEVYGFGEVNILHSYHIFEGGVFTGSTTDPVANVNHYGWDNGDFDGTNDLYYDFKIEDGRSVTELSAALVWNIEVTDSDPDTAIFNATTSLANLDLELFDSTGSFLGLIVDSSLSTAYNLEHIYLTDLAAGDYTFKISGDSAVNYGFSWRITTVPEPSSFALFGLVAFGLISRRRRN